MKKLIVALMILSLAACKKTEESGYGKYIIGISNSTPKNYSIQVLLDDKNEGTIVVQASQTGNYTSRCSDLVYTATLQNVKILTNVSSGKHTFKLKDQTTGAIKLTGDFTMKADGCISQQVDF